MLFYCEISLDDKTGEVLRRGIDGGTIVLLNGYSVGGAIAGTEVSHAGAFSFDATALAEEERVDTSTLEGGANSDNTCSGEDVTALVLQPLQEASEVQLCALRFCGAQGLTSTSDADVGSCSALVEQQAQQQGTLSFWVTLEVYNPVAVSVALTGLRLSGVTLGVAPPPGDTPLASVEAGALVGCDLVRTAQVGAMAWSSLEAYCELRLGDTTGQVLSDLLLNATSDRSVSVSGGYAVDAEVLGVPMSYNGTIAYEFNLAQVTARVAASRLAAPRDYAEREAIDAGSGAAAAALSTCGEPFAEIDALLQLSKGSVTSCPAQPPSIGDALLGLEPLPAGNCITQCPHAPPALKEACDSMAAAGVSSPTLSSVCNVVNALPGRRLEVPGEFASEVLGAYASEASVTIGSEAIATVTVASEVGAIASDATATIASETTATIAAGSHRSYAPLSGRRLQRLRGGAGGGAGVCSTKRDCTSTNCQEMLGGILRTKLVHREEFTLFNPTYLNITAAATMQLRDETGCELWPFTLDVTTPLAIAGRSSETIAIDIRLSRLAALSIFDVDQVRKLMCLLEDPATARDVCSESASQVFLDVTLRATVLGTTIDVPLPRVSLQGVFFSNTTGCSCLVGGDEACKQDISALTVASLV